MRFRSGGTRTAPRVRKRFSSRITERFHVQASRKMGAPAPTLSAGAPAPVFAGRVGASGVTSGDGGANPRRNPAHEQGREAQSTPEEHA